jgi:hypothetical protein
MGPEPVKRRLIYRGSCHRESFEVRGTSDGRLNARALTARWRWQPPRTSLAGTACLVGWRRPAAESAAGVVLDEAGFMTMGELVVGFKDAQLHKALRH